MPFYSITHYDWAGTFHHNAGSVKDDSVFLSSLLKVVITYSVLSHVCILHQFCWRQCLKSLLFIVLLLDTSLKLLLWLCTYTLTFVLFCVLRASANVSMFQDSLSVFQLILYDTVWGFEAMFCRLIQVRIVLEEKTSKSKFNSILQRLWRSRNFYWVVQCFNIFIVINESQIQVLYDYMIYPKQTPKRSITSYLINNIDFFLNPKKYELTF